MLMNRSVMLLAAASALLPGCAIKPPALTRTCAIPSIPVDPRPGATPSTPGAGQAPASLEAALALALAARPAASSGAAPPAPPRHLLYLSGGGPTGSFGAGTFHQWALNRCRRQGLQRSEAECLDLMRKADRPLDQRLLPDFDVVTCISTGCLQAGFLLADRPDLVVRGYNITREADVLTPFLKGGREKLTGLGGAISVARNGAVGDLEPLRRRLRQLLMAGDDHPDMLLRIADVVSLRQEGDANRPVLLAGVVDVDQGGGHAFDIGAVAQRYRAALARGDTAGATTQRECFIDAVVASSSEPLAARPVFIDNRMYLDGGVRMGVFDDVMANALQGAQEASATLFINGTLETEPRCQKADPKQCGESGDDRDANRAGARKPWNIADLALRSVGIMANANYRTNAALIDRNAKLSRRALNSVTLDGAGLATHKFEGKSCTEWREADKAAGPVLQFHANHMRCLIDFARTRACAAGPADKPGRFEGGLPDCGSTPAPATMATLGGKR
jgi:hypothetical protein